MSRVCPSSSSTLPYRRNMLRAHPTAAAHSGPAFPAPHENTWRAQRGLAFFAPSSPHSTSLCHSSQHALLTPLTRILRCPHACKETMCSRREGGPPTTAASGGPRVPRTGSAATPPATRHDAPMRMAHQWHAFADCVTERTFNQLTDRPDTSMCGASALRLSLGILRLC